MLGDTLRTGIFTDKGGHASLLARVEEDAPSALSFRTQALLTLSMSDKSQRSSTAPAMGNALDTTGQGRMSETAANQSFTHGAPLPVPCDDVFDNFSSQRLAPDLDLHGHEMEFSWLESLDESGDKGLALDV